MNLSQNSEIKLTFQSTVMTSLLFSFVLPLTCFSTSTFKGPLEVDLELPSAIVHIRAVESPDLDFYQAYSQKLLRFTALDNVTIP